MACTREYLLRLENNLMVGSGRWVADFVESFWDYPVGAFMFDMFVRGTTRPEGLILSRLLALTTLPNYQVACFAYTSDAVAEQLPGVLEAVCRYMGVQEIEWAWLIIPSDSPFSLWARELVEENNIRTLGISLVDLSSQDIVSNRSYMGRQMRRFIQCFK